MVSNRRMSIHVCMEHCSQHTYFGIADTMDCYCGNEVFDRFQLSESACDKPCPRGDRIGDYSIAKFACGGNGA